MRHFIFYLAIFNVFVSQAQYQNPIEIYKDSLDPNLSFLYPNVLLDNFDNQANKDVLVIKNVDENVQEIGMFTHLEEGDFNQFSSIEADINEVENETLFYHNLDGDALSELIYISNRNQINILKNNGGGSFGNPSTINLFSQITDRNYRINSIGDIDGDNDQDLIITQYVDKMYPPLEDSSEIILGFNDGSGNFSFEYMENDFSAAYYKIELADFDDDDDLDLITVGFGFAPDFGIEVPWYEFPFFRWYKNNGDGSFSAPIELELPQRVDRLPSVSDIHIADLEGDGDMDVFASFAIRDTCEDQIHAFNCSFIYVYGIWQYDDNDDNLIQTNEINSWPHNYLIEDNNDYYKDFFNPVYADFNNDGNIDILTINTITNNIFWRLGDGTGLFDNQSVVGDLNSLEIRPVFKVADMNSDGDLDIVSLLNSDTLSILQYYMNGVSGPVDFDNDGFYSDVDCNDLDSLIGDFLPDLSYEDFIVQCENTELIFSTDNELEDAIYYWSGPNGFNSNDAEPIIESISESNSGVYKVYATLNHCTSDTSEVEVTVNEQPEATIQQIEDSLVANVVEFSAYQWYLNGDLIEGAISDFYIPTESGFYQVEIINDLGCSNISDSLQVNIVGIKQNSTKHFNLFPNPIRNGAQITVEVNNQIEVPVLIKIFDSTGKIYYDGQLTQLNSKLNKINLSSGIYYLKLQNTTAIYVEQLVVID